MIWPNNFSDRLQYWNQLRDQCHDLDIETALKKINAWWFKAPWRPYYLHWDDQADWPDPWQLLSDNIYCDLARGLGILYTISLLDRPDLQPADLILTDLGHNLVQSTKTKYILNWLPDDVVNNNLKFKVSKQYRHRTIK